MRRLLLLTALLGLAACATFIHRPTTGLVLYAQNVPATVRASWSPNAAADNATRYKVTLDGGGPISVPPTACSASECLQALTITAFGPHVVTVVAVNQKISTDPTSEQDSPPLTLNWSLLRPAGTPTGGTVKQ